MVAEAKVAVVVGDKLDSKMSIQVLPAKLHGKYFQFLIYEYGDAGQYDGGVCW